MKLVFTYATIAIFALLSCSEPTSNDRPTENPEDSSIDSVAINMNSNPENQTPEVDLKRAAEIVHESFYRENHSEIGNLLNSEKELKLIVSHSISEQPDEVLLLNGADKIAYFTDPVVDEYTNRGESIFDTIEGNKALFNTMLLHNTLFISELEFSDDEHPQLIMMKLIDGD